MLSFIAFRRYSIFTFLYEIQKGKNANFTLKIDKLPEATIQINAKGKMTFTHKKVNIDNKIYTLKIDANKE